MGINTLNTYGIRTVPNNLGLSKQTTYELLHDCI